MTYLPPLFPMTEAESKADKPSEGHTGAMIALRPRQDHIDRLAVVDGEPPKELHTTILFMGKADEYDYDLRARVVYAMRDLAQYFRVVEGNGFFVAPFNPNGEDPCIVLGVGGKELVEIRNAILDKLSGLDLSLKIPENHEPWVPHVTLEYTDDTSKVTELIDLTGPIHYDAIRVAFGGIVDDIDLRPITAETEGYRYNAPSYVGGNRYDFVKGMSLTSGLATKRGGLKVKQKCKYCTKQATDYVLHSEGHGYVPFCKGHKGKATHDAAHCTPDGTRDMSNIIRYGKLPTKTMEELSLRAAIMSTKLITPGGRVGSDRSLGSRSNGENWVEKTPMGRLPKYIRIVANGLIKEGHSKSKAIAMAVAAMERWKRGGDNVRPQVQAAAAAASAEWAALKASS